MVIDVLFLSRVTKMENTEIKVGAGYLENKDVCGWEGTKKWSGSNPAHREDLIIDRRE
jgi:hypothetical protein